MFVRLTDQARRRRNARHLERRMAELDRLDREHGLGTMPYAAPAGRRRTGRGRDVLVATLTLGVVAGLVAFMPGDDFRSLRRLVGFEKERTLAPPEFAAAQGSFTFMQTQNDGVTPVGYDPCTPIEVLVNPDGAPENHERLVSTGLAHVSQATGLEFRRVGTTTDRRFPRTAMKTKPILIMWADADEVPELAGNVAGVGGSTAVERLGQLRYATGQVVLDRDSFAQISPDDERLAQAIVDHELAHLVGLGHVDDPTEVMYENNAGVTRFGPGDREGLARLGSLPCR